MKNKLKFRVIVPSVLVFLISFLEDAHFAAAKTGVKPATLKMKPLQTELDDRQHFSRLLAQNSPDSDSAHEKWKNLTPEQKEAFREKYKKLKNLSPAKKAEIREKYRKFKNLTPEQQQKIRRNWKRYKNLSEEERKILRKRLKY